MSKITNDLASMFYAYGRLFAKLEIITWKKYMDLDIFNVPRVVISIYEEDYHE